jgi:hypothetical protein
MPVIKGSSIEKARVGSLENKIEAINSMVSEKYKEIPFTVLATCEDRAVVLLSDGTVRDIFYTINEDNTYGITSDRVNKSIDVISEDRVINHVSEQLSYIVSTMVKDKDLSRTQVRELLSLVNKDDLYWLSDVDNVFEDITKESEWMKMYDTNIERIRTSLYGNIRAIEANVPKIKYSSIPKNKIGDFYGEVTESMCIVKDSVCKVSESCNGIQFKDKEEFLGSIRDSLIAEAQSIGALLGKAEKLYRQDGLPLLANIHDKLADRVRVMAVMSEYLKDRAKPINKEND